ncbi:hypothetical protein [Secundilactobacillus kimchicus]|uniref:Uncharacterized protein n=1 Tax=Secundilactobacillus kimchicus JCM 15530 TaxID=1302272 RepID=A0A0R1HXR1_9LACO|nr:hypothetical protein [Secundilactobacillus kimchicus]KRK48202.1 hypothetical protein FC96_GL001941 [Secundilactobacillus kimchicus JCM 15530]
MGLIIGNTLIWDSGINPGTKIFEKERFFMHGSEYLGNASLPDNAISGPNIKLSSTFDKLDGGLELSISGMAITDYTNFYKYVPFTNPPNKTKAGSAIIWSDRDDIKFLFKTSINLTKQQLQTHAIVSLIEVSKFGVGVVAGAKIQSIGTDTLTFLSNYSGGSGKSTCIYTGTDGNGYIDIDSITAY